jgi:hypothetical protein
LDTLNTLNLPFGYDDMPSPWWSWLWWSWLGWKIPGLLVTTIAVSLGAPFWFDVLQKFANVRNAGKPPEKSTPAYQSTPEKKS